MIRRSMSSSGHEQGKPNAIICIYGDSVARSDAGRKTMVKNAVLEGNSSGFPISGNLSKRPAPASGVITKKRQRKAFKTSICTTEDTFRFYCAGNGDEDDHIDPDGATRLCTDLGVSPEDPVMIAVSYAMNAENLGYFSRREFMYGMNNLKCATIEDLRSKLPELRGMLDPRQPLFVEIYRFAYLWACPINQKSLEKETAIGLWRILLHPFGCTLLETFLSFVEQKKLRGVTKDLWIQLYHFINQAVTTSDFLKMYNSETSAWPVVIDQFIETIL